MIELFESARLLSIAWGFAAQFLKLDDPVTLWVFDHRAWAYICPISPPKQA